MAIAYAGGKVYAGGNFTNAGGNANADFLAVWDGASWQPFCSTLVPGPSIGGNVDDLQVIGGTLFVGGEFQNGGGISSADYLLACDLATGASSSTVTNDGDLSGSVYALTADSNGVLYAAGTFINLAGNLSSDHVAAYSGGTWSNLGSVPGPAFGAVTGIARSLAASGTNVYIGDDQTNIAGIPQADHIARWDGAAWSAVGANAAGTDGYLPVSASVDDLLTSGSHVYATGSFQDAGGDPTADNVADFDGTTWHSLGSNGLGSGALPAAGEGLAMFGGKLHVGGNFTSAGGNRQAAFLARFNPNPTNAFKLGGPKINKRNGTATLSVKVPGPGVLKLRGNGIKPGRRVPSRSSAGSSAARPVTAAGTVKLTVKPDKKTKRKLAKKGSAKVTVKITFTPTGGTANIKSKKLKLIKKH